MNKGRIEEGIESARNLTRGLENEIFENRKKRKELRAQLRETDAQIKAEKMSHDKIKEVSFSNNCIYKFNYKNII